MRGLGLIAICAALTACASQPLPVPTDAAAQEQARVFRTLDGREFATEAERSAYLRNTDLARRERELIALERQRQQRLVNDLGYLQAERRAARAEYDDRRAAAVELSAALAAAEAARREGRAIDRSAGEARTRTEREAFRQARDRAERAEDRAEDLARQARDRAAGEGRQSQRDRRTGDNPPPWQRLERYRREGEPLPDFRRRVVGAIESAKRDGGQVGDYLAE